MKKILSVFAVFAIFSVFAFADMPMDPNSMPAPATAFINQNFPGKTVTFAKSDWDDFEVYLNDGTQIEFWTDGTWKDVKSYAGVPTGILPPNVVGQITAAYPNVAIVEVEKKRGSFEVQLMNRMKMYFNTQGVLIGQHFDD